MTLGRTDLQLPTSERISARRYLATELHTRKFLGQPLQLVERFRVDCADSLLDDADLNGAAGVEELGRRVRSKRINEIAVRATHDQILYRQLGQCIRYMLRIDVEVYRQLFDFQELLGQQGPFDYSLTQIAISRLVEGALQSAESAAKVRERGVLGARRLLDPREEDGVGSAHYRLFDLTLEMRERVLDQRDPGPAAHDVDSLELVLTLSSEFVRNLALVLGEDVHAEDAGVVDRHLSIARLVQADQEHRRVHRQR